MGFEPSRTRTCDPLVKSQLLYRLSYRPIYMQRARKRRALFAKGTKGILQKVRGIVQKTLAAKGTKKSRVFCAFCASLWLIIALCPCSLIQAHALLLFPCGIGCPSHPSLGLEVAEGRL